MALAESYTLKPNALPEYLEAVLNAQPPERFTVKFLEQLGFTSTNDRLLIGILKDLGFINRDAAPQQRYFDYLDRTRSKRVLADGIRGSFSELFAVNIKAHETSLDEIRNKLRTLFAGKKTDLVIGNIARTFRALCDLADFSAPAPGVESAPGEVEVPSVVRAPLGIPVVQIRSDAATSPSHHPVKFAGLQYHINIALPETRDQSVYDAIFRSLREHLG